MKCHSNATHFYRFSLGGATGRGWGGYSSPSTSFRMLRRSQRKTFPEPSPEADGLGGGGTRGGWMGQSSWKPWGEPPPTVEEHTHPFHTKSAKKNWCRRHDPRAAGTRDSRSALRATPNERGREGGRRETTLSTHPVLVAVHLPEQVDRLVEHDTAGTAEGPSDVGGQLGTGGGGTLSF